ncbi:MAG: glycosyltransferase family 4 protein [Candidatus Amulumruptor caecigallinarius]|nr:glycosyltransferase family 4 protein [Candidatus Amulumruptor caecigallinarius]MCM1396486.1 glycosyltransferase family 4 protein [Candidatus Amulumruptor caecigallinarius]MCM1453457.1 glycosyltransferase family 4 protein [bacterium]
MKIGFDAKRALANFTGLGNYSRLVIDTLAREFPDSELLLYAPKGKVPPVMEPTLALPNVTLHTPQGWMWRRLSGLWRVRGGLTDEIRRDGPDLYHGLSNELPLDIAKAGCASVVTIHDLIFRHHPRGYKAVDRAIYDYKFRHAAKAATRVIAISEATRRDLIASYDIEPEKIDVVYQGCDAQFREPVSDEAVRAVRERYGLEGRYIVAVGSVEPRKNQQLLIEALRGLPADVKAVIVGRRNHDYGRELDGLITRRGLGDRVLFIEGAPFTDLPALYAGATVAAYTSRIEGFGIPVIEAINCGTPVVACTGTCLEEAGGPGALYVHPENVEEAVHAFSHLLDDKLLRADMVLAGQRYVSRFVPEKFTADLLATYARALAEYEK